MTGQGGGNPAGDASPAPEWLSARALLARHGLRPKKSWGQNFLEDRRVVARIVDAAQAAPGSPVVEIGAGLGALTHLLAARGFAVTAVERDPDLVAVLTAEFGAGGVTNVTIFPADALEVDLGSLAAAAGQSLTVIGNLPYQITTPLLFRVLGAAAAGQVVRRGVFMVQKEVAERITARPGSKAYGRLTVMLQQSADVKILFHVAPGAFLPPPQVTSTVFELVPRATPRAPVESPALLDAVVRAAFGGRRKMLRRALDPLGGEVLPGALAQAGLAGTERAEQLSVEDFARVTNALHAAGVKPAAGSPADEDPEDADDDA